MNRFVSRLLVALAVAGVTAPAVGGEPRLSIRQRDDDPTRIVVEAAGLDPKVALGNRDAGRWRSFLIVHVAGTGQVPPLLGTYRLDGDVLRFDPRFPIEPGVRYRAEFDPAGALGREGVRAPMTADLSVGALPKLPKGTATAVYPSRSTLPENLLRFYIHFSAPMGRGSAYQHIHLLDESGKPIADPFLEIDEELWSNDGRRFTLLFDPGRVKRGLKPREEVGPVLVAGNSYTLVVDAGWPDAEGHPLKSGFRKTFRTVAADETSPDPKNWAIRPPSSGTREPLEVRFPEPIDRALLDRLIAVRSPDDRSLAGSIAVDDEETRWRFTPEAPWTPGPHHLVVGSDLEDVAGNSVARPFEVDEFRPITARTIHPTVAVPFRIGHTTRD